MKEVYKRFYPRFLKRPMDFVLSLFLLMLTFPLLLLIAVIVRITIGPKVLFKQNRPGLNEKIFTLYKFRTMTDARDETGELLEDKDRMTKFGTFLRETSLDELPELINILMGDMSFIGPRPLLIKYLPLYDDNQRHRHDVRPGLSGLAQINGRNTINWTDKFEHDLKYTRNITLFGDIAIMWKTFQKVIKREGIHSETASTIEEFKGNNEEQRKEKKLIIVGAGGHGRSAAGTAMKMKKWDTILFLDDDPQLTESMGIKVIGKTSEAQLYCKDADVFVAVGNNSTRQRLVEEYVGQGLTMVTLIHPNAILGEQVTVGNGTIVMAGAIINCCSWIGKGCIVNTGATVDHDGVIEDYVHISPGAHLAGSVHVGIGCWLGIGSVISNNINITGGCIVGAGSVVMKDLTEAGTYVGTPVRRL